MVVVREMLSPVLGPLPAIGTADADVLRLRVWPADIDFNLHLNNARYLSIMDYGRIHLLARGGLLRMILKEKWTPLVGAVWMTYRRPLPLFARYELATRLVCWDKRWFYMEQIFTGEDGLVAVGWVKGALHESAGLVNPQRLMDKVQPGIVSPPIPEGLETLNDLTREKLQAAR